MFSSSVGVEKIESSVVSAIFFPAFFALSLETFFPLSLVFASCFLRFPELSEVAFEANFEACSSRMFNLRSKESMPSGFFMPISTAILWSSSVFF